MVVGMFPIAKLGYLALRQVSKPIANIIKGQAKRSTFFREKVCIPPAQLYHYWETVIKMRMYGLGKPDNVKQLNLEAAVDLGADMLGELVIFSVGALALFLEYLRQTANTTQREQSQFQRIADLERRVAQLQVQVETLEQNANKSTLQKLVPGFLKRSSDSATHSDSKPESNTQTELSTPAGAGEKRSELEPGGKAENSVVAGEMKADSNAKASSKTVPNDPRQQQANLDANVKSEKPKAETNSNSTMPSVTPKTK